MAFDLGLQSIEYFGNMQQAGKNYLKREFHFIRSLRAEGIPLG